MKWLLMNLAITYIVACADDTGDATDAHPRLHRALRALLWPLTLTTWFRSQNCRLHRLLTILWTLLIGGWLLSLLNDKL